MFRKSFTLLLALFLLGTVLVTQVGAQSSAATASIIATQAELDDSRYPDISFFVTPVNQSGVPINNLGAQDFVLNADGRVVPPNSYRISPEVYPDETVYIVLALDISGSMRPSLAELKQAALFFLDEASLNPNDQIAIVGFNDLSDRGGVNMTDTIAAPFPQLDEQREINFTSDRNRLRNFINVTLSIDEPNAGTPLYDAMFKSVRMLEEATTFGRRAVIVMTDGADMARGGTRPGSVFSLSADDAIDRARDARIPIFTIGIGNDIEPQILQRTATLTGGIYQSEPDVSNLGELFQEIVRRLKVRYRVDWQAQVVPDNTPHRMLVSVGNTSTELSFVARYPLQPWVREVSATLPRQEARAYDALPNAKGIVDIQPAIAARNAISEVRYYVNGYPGEVDPVYIATAAPYTFRWDTTTLAPNEEHLLVIEAIDDTPEANAGLLALPPLLIEPCNMICIFEQRTGIPPLYILGAIAAALLLLILFMARRNRSQAGAEMPDLYVRPSSGTMPDFVPPAPVAPVMPPPPTPEPPPTGRIDAGAAGGAAGQGWGGAPAAGGEFGRSASPKTVVLKRQPSRIAFLIDGRNGRQHQLGDDNTIGRDGASDIILDDSSVSGRHAKIRLENNRFVLADLASTNGTTVNGNSIVRHELHDNDRITFGGVSLVFKTIDNPA